MCCLSYLLIAVVSIATHFTFHQSTASCYKGGGLVASTLQTTDADPAQDMPSDGLDEILKQDTQSAVVIQSILGGLALCYNILANLLLYPIFSFVLLLLSMGGIVLVGLWIKKIKKEQSIATTWVLFTCLYVLLYLDLFLVVYQKREVLFLFLKLEKDLFLMVTSGAIGYVVGKFFSSKFFEEKKLP